MSFPVLWGKNRALGGPEAAVSVNDHIYIALYQYLRLIFNALWYRGVPKRSLDPQSESFSTIPFRDFYFISCLCMKKWSHISPTVFGRFVVIRFLNVMSRTFQRYHTWRNPELTVGDVSNRVLFLGQCGRLMLFAFLRQNKVKNIFKSSLHMLFLHKEKLLEAFF